MRAKARAEAGAGRTSEDAPAPPSPTALDTCRHVRCAPEGTLDNHSLSAWSVNL